MLLPCSCRGEYPPAHVGQTGTVRGTAAGAVELAPNARLGTLFLHLIAATSTLLSIGGPGTA
eukprot:scaffold306690_cov35-Tisochrysis_lutea.AAC.3